MMDSQELKYLKETAERSNKLFQQQLENSDKSDKRKYRFRMFAVSYLFLSIGLFTYFLKGPSDINTQEVQHIALVNIIGSIERDGDVSAYQTMDALQDAFENENSVAVVLNADSPGGSPAQSDLIYNEILRLKKEYPDKPVISVISDICASGCYYISSAADQILANKTSIVGSIGVKMDSFAFTELMTKVGVERRSISAGEFKHLVDPFQQLDPYVTDHIQKYLVSSTHEVFINAVKQGRGDRLVNDPDLFSGLVWTGQAALDRGLIDGFGDIYQLAREKTEDAIIHNYSKKVPNLMNLFTSASAQIASSFVNSMRASIETPRVN